MSQHSTMYYVQNCPTCGRRLQIRVEHLGKKLVCQHCRAHFVACDKELSPDGTTSEKAEELLRRAEELLKRVSHESQIARVANPR